MLATVLAGCGGSPTAGPAPQQSDDVDQVLDHAQELTGQAQIDYLVEAAKKEGGPLRLYTSYSSESVDALVAAFEKKYGIEVSSYRASSQDLSQRVSQETAAHYDQGADFVEMRGIELYQLSQQGYLRSFTGDFTNALPDFARSDAWTADRLNVIVPCWNTQAVPQGQEPKSYEELAEPQWAGKLAIEQADVNWFQTLFTYLVGRGMTEDQAEDYFRTVVANGHVVKGHTEMQQFISAGQYDLGIDCYTYVTEGQIADGAPTAWKPAVEPAVIQPNGIAVMKSAAHPAAAALFYQWVLTDGQQILADTGNTAVTESDAEGGIPLDIAGYAKDAEKWRTLYNDILSGK